MKANRRIAGFLAPALLLAGCLMTPAIIVAEGTRDSPEISRLLADTKAEAVELRNDSADLDAFTRSDLTWARYADKLEMIKDHINKAGKLLAKLQAAEAEGSPWQQVAIQRIAPLLRELADNTSATINHLNENRARIHFSSFEEYVKDNHELAIDLEILIRDLVKYGETKERFELLGKSLEVRD